MTEKRQGRDQHQVSVFLATTSAACKRRRISGGRFSSVNSINLLLRCLIGSMYPDGIQVHLGKTKVEGVSHADQNYYTVNFQATKNT